MSAWEGSAHQEAAEREAREKARERETLPRLPEPIAVLGSQDTAALAEARRVIQADRVSWDRYFMDLAEAVSKRGTCDRKKVGAVLVVGKRLVATGYNGALAGLPHCDEVGHDLVDTLGPDGVARPNCVRTVHAEANAVAQAARHGVALDTATAYVNTYPCWPCFRLLASAGIARVVYADAYRPDERVQASARALGIVVERLA